MFCKIRIVALVYRVITGITSSLLTMRDVQTQWSYVQRTPLQQPAGTLSSRRQVMHAQDRQGRA